MCLGYRVQSRQEEILSFFLQDLQLLIALHRFVQNIVQLDQTPLIVQNLLFYLLLLS